MAQTILNMSKMIEKMNIKIQSLEKDVSVLKAKLNRTPVPRSPEMNTLHSLDGPPPASSLSPSVSRHPNAMTAQVPTQYIQYGHPPQYRH
mmetsp:Transcript_27193/g.30293  ORF Transcript_27193/g.30293 Transcript_27193/m.30293 type:complete len:90 (+) Transcript_27193:221-490(+)